MAIFALQVRHVARPDGSDSTTDRPGSTATRMAVQSAASVHAQIANVGTTDASRYEAMASGGIATSAKSAQLKPMFGLSLTAPRRVQANESAPSRAPRARSDDARAMDGAPPCERFP